VSNEYHETDSRYSATVTSEEETVYGSISVLSDHLEQRVSST
jgi:hypothetical protein